MNISNKLLELNKQLSEENLKTSPDASIVSDLENKINGLELAQIPFTVSARTARLIGQENFANAEGAIIELVKNSYDSDASICIIIVDPVNDSIHILDNGDGMTDTIIRNQWMTIGTDDKRINFRTKSRVKTGAKGIGRFALDRLGKSSVMITKTLQSESLVWNVNWNQFEKSGAVISDIKATLQVGDNSFINELSKIKKFTGVKEPFIDLWNEEKGTLISINGLKDTWDKKEIQSLFSNLEILVPPLETNIFQVFLYSTIEPDSYGKVLPTLCDDYDYRLTAIVQEDQKVDIHIYRNELSLGDLKRIGFFDKNTLNQPHYNLKAFENGGFEIITTLESLVAGFKDVDVNNTPLSKIGPFSFTFYFMKRGGGQEKDENIGKYPYKSVNYSNRTNWLDKFGGIKIFRDNFRVRPYGETKSSSFDWLDLGKRALSNPTVTRPGYRVRPQQVYGLVNISRIDNINFEDKSSREGLQENDTFTLFKEILKSIIDLFENDRNQIMMTLKRIYDERNKKRKAQEAAEQIIKNKNEKTTKSTEESNTEKDTLITAIEGYKEDIEELQDEQKILRVLASAGLIVTSFAHEFRNHADSILPRTNDLKEVLLQIIDVVKLKQLPDFFDPYVMLSDMRTQDERLKSWLDFSISAVRKDKRTRRIINMVAYIEGLEKMWHSLLSRRNIKITIEKRNFKEVNFKGYEIDLDGIFNNLITNSVDAYRRKDAGDLREIILSFAYNPFESNGISLVYQDFGPGLLEEISDPNKIFQPFYTTKRDEKTGEKIGTGLGMWIVKSTIDEYNGDVEIIQSRPNFKLKITLPHNL